MMSSLRLGSSVGNQCAAFIIIITSIFGNEAVPSRPLGECQEVQIPMCKALPYNVTRMPNLVDHSTQRAAMIAIDQYAPLVATGCSEYLVFFLCTMFAPLCTLERDTNHQPLMVPPCRSICQAARRGCEPVMAQYDVPWPKHLECDGLPDYNGGICITPSAFGIASPGNQSTNKQVEPPGLNEAGLETDTSPQSEKPKLARSNKHGNCRCMKSIKNMRRRIFLKPQWDFAARGTYLSSNQGTIEFRINEIITTSHDVITTNNDVTINNHQPFNISMTLANSECKCPSDLSTSADFLVLANLNAVGQLFYDQGFVWRDKWKIAFQKWERKMRRRKRKTKQRKRSKTKNRRRGRKQQRKKKKRKNIV